MIKLGTKVYRNIQEQVAKNTDDIAKLWRRPIFQIKVVDELPEEGEASTLYLLPVEDPEEGNYYEEYLWVDGAWELVGTTAVDISNMVTTDTDQTITGAKTIDNELIFNNGTAWLKITNNGWESTIQQQGGLGLTFGANALRATTNRDKDLGADFAKWKDLYLSGEIKVGQYGSKVKEDNGALFLQGSSGVIKADNTLRPTSNNSKDLGETNYRWKDLYLSGNITDGTNSVSVADLAALITYAKAQGWIS